MSIIFWYDIQFNSILRLFNVSESRIYQRDLYSHFIRFYKIQILSFTLDITHSFTSGTLYNNKVFQLNLVLVLQVRANI